MSYKGNLPYSLGLGKESGPTCSPLSFFIRELVKSSLGSMNLTRFDSHLPYYSSTHDLTILD